MSYQSIFSAGLFKDQVVIVTGGGSGIGRCTAHELSALGASVALVGRKLDKLEKVDGYAYTDALMSVFTGMTGVTEGGLNIVSGYFALRASGGKLVLGSTMTRAAVVRLAAGVAGVDLPP